MLDKFMFACVEAAQTILCRRRLGWLPELEATSTCKISETQKQHGREIMLHSSEEVQLLWYYSWVKLKFTTIVCSKTIISLQTFSKS